MKCAGIIGGLSPESTISYYKGLNAGVRASLGGYHSARVLIAGVDFGRFCALKAEGDWTTQAGLLAQEAKRLEAGGADFILLASNTMHKCAADIEAAISIPFLHLADMTAEKIRASRIKKIGVLGTRYTMEEDFYTARLEEKGLTPIVPAQDDRHSINRIIYEELTHGVVSDSSREIYREVIVRLARAGAEGVILGCTEIGLLIGRDDSPLPLFDTTQIHIDAGLAAMLTA